MLEARNGGGDGLLTAICRGYRTGSEYRRWHNDAVILVDHVVDFDSRCGACWFNLLSSYVSCYYRRGQAQQVPARVSGGGATAAAAKKRQ